MAQTTGWNWFGEGEVCALVHFGPIHLQGWHFNSWAHFWKNMEGGPV